MKDKIRQKKSITQAITLIELMVVVIIIGILAGISIPKYLRSREKTIDKQAQTTLSLIRAAERTRKMDTGSYYPTSGSTTSVPDINNNLRLDLVDDGNWGYSVGGTGATFTATLTRNKGGYNRQWTIDSTINTPICTGICP